MSEIRQLDIHPDAESLNAFAENALAVDERERVATHLAVCGYCREVVFLAQDAAEEMEPALVAVAAAADVERDRWYKNWRLAWIPAAALAASVTVAYVVHVQRVMPATQLAQIERRSAPPGVDTVKGVAAPEKKAPAVEKDMSSAETTRRTAAAKANEPMNTKENALQTPAGAAPGLRPMPESTARQQQQEAAEARNELQAFAAKRAMPEGRADRAEQMQGQLQVAAAPMQKTEVAPRFATSSAGAERGIGGSLVAYLSKPAALPTGLPVISTATVQKLMLAVDKAGSVYTSSDAGAHWESVAKQWSGRAVAVRTKATAMTNAAHDGGTPEQKMFELVNDQGQVWVSADGRSWKAE